VGSTVRSVALLSVADDLATPLLDVIAREEGREGKRER
jgi:hypothetical protein